jgi:leucyl aminopeptidase (aminopeptidase T)
MGSMDLIGYRIMTPDDTMLAEVARSVVQRYLGVTAADRTLVVGDDGTDPAVLTAIMAAAAETGCDATLATITARGSSGDEPPAVLAAAMADATVVLCALSRSLYHTNAKGRAQAAGARGCFNAPHLVDAWTHGAMTADFAEIRAVAERLAGRLRGAQEVHVTSPAGTDVTMRIDGREPKGWLTGICRSPGEVSAYPGGEVSLPPLEGTTSGTVVIERVMTDLGALADPITWTVRDGLVVAIDGGEQADRLRAMIDGVEGATNIAELGIGLNPLARIGPHITEAKKRLGTAHMAIGDNAGGYGGVVECPLHLDGLILDVTIVVDGADVVRDGVLQL